MTALVQIPDMDLVAVFAGEQQLRVNAIFHHVRSAPFGGNHRVVPEVPPKIVSQVLWATILFPGSLQLKRIRIHQENASGAVSVGGSERTPVDGVRATMKCVRRSVAGLLDEFLRLDDLHNLRLLGIRLRIQDVYPGRPDAWDDQITTFHVRMRGLGAETRAAGVPAEVM